MLSFIAVERTLAVFILLKANSVGKIWNIWYQVTEKKFSKAVKGRMQLIGNVSQITILAFE